MFPWNSYNLHSSQISSPYDYFFQQFPLSLPFPHFSFFSYLIWWFPPSLIWTGQIPFSCAITSLCWNASLICKLSQQAAVSMLARTASSGKVTKNGMISTSLQATLSRNKQHLYLFFYNLSCSTQFFLSPLNPFFSLPQKEPPHSTALVSSSGKSLVKELQIISLWVAFWTVKKK